MRRVLLLAIVAASWLCGAAGAQARRPPNVVFILADDLGWADIGAYGSKFHDTPNLDRLAKRSVRLSRYYAASPLCSPTRSSLLTGLYPARTGITAPACHLPQVQLEKRLSAPNPRSRVLNAESLTRLKGEYVTLAEHLKAAGYSTAHFGKWHLGHGAGYEPRDQGFDVDIPHTPSVPGPGGGYLAPWRFVRDPALQGAPGEHIDEWMAGRAAKWISERKDGPFYLNFWLYSVHSPWNAKPELIEKFKPTADPNSGQRNPLYAGMVKSMDDAVGRLLDSLEAAGVAENTVVVFTSDNGGWAYPPRATQPAGYETIPATSNAPLRSGKASNYEGGTRVPCLISWPGHFRPRTSDALFSSVDFLPTLLSITGVKPATKLQLDGVDQLPTIRGDRNCRETVYVHFPHGSEAQEQGIPGFWPATWVRKGDWKLIRFYARNENLSDRWELYDLKSDPGETKDLAAGRPEKVRELSGLIEKFLKDTEAVVPRANPARRDNAGVTGWSPSKDAALDVRENALVVTSTGSDPFLQVNGLPAGRGPYSLDFRMRSGSGGAGQVFWRVVDGPPFHRDRAVGFTPQHDGSWRDYNIRIPPEAPLAALRIDPAAAPGEIRFEWIRVFDGKGELLKEWIFAAPLK